MTRAEESGASTITEDEDGPEPGVEVEVLSVSAIKDLGTISIHQTYDSYGLLGSSNSDGDRSCTGRTSGASLTWAARAATSSGHSRDVDSGLYCVADCLVTCVRATRTILSGPARLSCGCVDRLKDRMLFACFDTKLKADVLTLYFVL